MREIVRLFVIPLLCLILVFNLKAQSLKSGFEALNAYDLFKAKRIFEKKLGKKTNSVAAYGLAELYMKPKNIFQNADSAFFYIKMALVGYDQIKEKTKSKFSSFGYNQKRLHELRQLISSELFEVTRQANSEIDYAEFISNHYWAREVEEAIHLRDSIAYHKSLKLGTTAALEEFLKQYPTTSFSKSAQDAFNKFQFEEQTKNKTRLEYTQFLYQFPDNPYTKEADLALYKMAQEVNSIEAYHQFIKSFPKSNFYLEAWKSLYKAYLNAYGIAWIELFKKEYPDYPFMSQLNEEYALVKSVLLPYFNGSKWGFMDDLGSTIITPKYDYVELFSQGRAAVQINERYGFIDALGNWIIQPQFSDATSFRSNLSVVYDQKDQAGLINLFGEFVLEPNFENIYIISDEYVWVQNQDYWLIYNIKTKNYGQTRYQDVGSFENFRIIVQRQEDYAVINLKEEVIFSNPQPIGIFGNLYYVLTADSAHFYNDKGMQEMSLQLNEVKLGTTETLTPFRRGEKIGYLNPDGKIQIEPIYDVYQGWQFFASFKHDHAKAYDSRARKYGLINTNGLWAIPARFDDLSVYSDQIAVQTKGRWEYISKTGEKLNIGSFELAESFIAESGIVRLEGKFGLINAQGEYLINPEMNQIIRFGDAVLRWEDAENNFWLGNNFGVKVLDQPCQSIDKIDDNIIRLICNKQVFYYLLEEQKLVRPQGHE